MQNERPDAWSFLQSALHSLHFKNYKDCTDYILVTVDPSVVTKENGLSSDGLEVAEKDTISYVWKLGSGTSKMKWLGCSFNMKKIETKLKRLRQVNEGLRMVGLENHPKNNP